MKPKPFSALNHFTVPCGISRSFLLFLPGAVHRLPAYRARSDRHTFVESPELDPTYNPRRNRDRNVDPASAYTRTQKLRPPIVNHDKRFRDSLAAATREQFIHRRATMSDFGRELLACAVDGTDPEEKPL